MLSYAGAGVSDQDVEGGQDKSLLQRSDLSWMLALMVVGLGLRLLYFSGFGLDDDQIFRGNIAFVLRGKSLTGDNVSYRLTWLLPSALSCKIFGLTELGMIFPITAIATLAIGLVYMFGKALWDTPGGIIAALLLIVHPLDVAWSTMLSNDITLSFFSTLSVFLMMRALQHEDPVWKCRLWVLGALSLWLAFQAKISAVFLAPAIAAICWTNRRRLGAQFTDFLVTVTMLFGATALVYYLFRDDPIAPYHAELRFQGLVGAEAIHHRLTAEWFWTYPRLLFFRDRLGDFLFSVYPHLLVGLGLASWSLGIRTSREVFWWLLSVFLGMQFNVQRADGVWITGFRNVRHGHVLVVSEFGGRPDCLGQIAANAPQFIDAGLIALAPVICAVVRPADSSHRLGLILVQFPLSLDQQNSRGPVQPFRLLVAIGAVGRIAVQILHHIWD